MRTFLPLAVILLIACSRSEEEESRPGGRAVDQEVKKFRLVQTLWGDKTWELEAERLEEREDTTWVYDFTLLFYDREGIQTSTLFVDSGTVFERLGDLNAYGRVRVQTGDGSVLKTESLRWNQMDRLIETDDPVVVEKGDKVVRGTGLVSDANLDHITIRGEVESTGK
jgi:LPS export ABC transporter protein LptC